MAEAAVRHIAQLYAIEAMVRGSSPDIRLAARKEHSLPIIAALKPWFEKRISGARIWVNECAQPARNPTWWFIGRAPAAGRPCGVTLSRRLEKSRLSGLGPVWSHLEFITAAVRLIMASKLISVLSARMAIRLNSLSLQKKFSIRCRHL
ncbi:IS66 family transposase [Bradyrhizobium sp. 2S1]|uniref:IS66 family transposase n=1 Tax=Bradyrhizobium sp. 2S1 TaxID=1404429 RepID=UPI0030CAC284